MSNFLLVSGKSGSGDPEGVSPSLARAIAERIGVPIRYVPFPRPGELADAVGTDTWDIGLIGAEPQRAEKIAFTAAYAEIEATIWCRRNHRFRALPMWTGPVCGSRSRHVARTACGSSGISGTPSGSKSHFCSTVRSGSSSRTSWMRWPDCVRGLLDDVKKLPGARILDGQFMSVQQAVGTAAANKSERGVPARLRGGGEIVGPDCPSDRAVRHAGPADGCAARLVLCGGGEVGVRRLAADRYERWWNREWRGWRWVSPSGFPWGPAPLRDALIV